jgi:hypothetical protein
VAFGAEAPGSRHAQQHLVEAGATWDSFAVNTGTPRGLHTLRQTRADERAGWCQHRLAIDGWLSAFDAFLGVSQSLPVPGLSTCL